MDEKIIKTKTVCKKLGISRTSFWRLRQSGLFPAAGSVSGTGVRGWRQSDVERWIDKYFPVHKND